jgi:hypothetical protein
VAFPVSVQTEADVFEVTYVSLPVVTLVEYEVPTELRWC